MPAILRRSLSRALALAGGLALLAVTGCDRPVNRTAERLIREVLPDYLGPARAWRVRVHNPWDRTLAGRLQSVAIEGEEVELRSLVQCVRLSILLSDVKVDTRRRLLREVRRAEFRAEIDQDALNEYLRRSPPTDDDPVRIRRVTVRDGALHAEATRWLLGRAWPFTVTVRPELVSDTRVFFSPERMTVIGLPVPLPSSVLRWLALRLSDGMDFSSLPFALRLSRLEVHAGRLVAEGEADVAESLNATLARRSR
ncbi:MAG TPA: DUF2993 domain-containing protein [Chthonomonadales bacterium]|nr:DUF2993 domain-containing protein [Chthonomonadales bacterium]